MRIATDWTIGGPTCAYVPTARTCRTGGRWQRMGTRAFATGKTAAGKRPSDPTGDRSTLGDSTTPSTRPWPMTWPPLRSMGSSRGPTTWWPHDEPGCVLLQRLRTGPLRESRRRLDVAHGPLRHLWRDEGRHRAPGLRADVPHHCFCGQLRCHVLPRVRDGDGHRLRRDGQSPPQPHEMHTVPFFVCRM